MIKPNDFSTANRQDDLLNRLKQCVGSIENASKDTKKATLIRQPESFSSRQVTFDYANEKKYESRPSSYRQSLGVRQNFTDKKYHSREKDSRQLTGDKQNHHIAQKAKNYLENSLQITKSYRTERKPSLPLAETSNLSNIKRELFVKDVSDSTKKRIAERESLINGDNVDSERAIPVQIPERQKNKTFQEDQFLERLSLRKISYYDQSSSKQQSHPEVPKKTKEIASQNQRGVKFPIEQFKQPSEPSSSRAPLQKYQTYSKVAMENLVRDQDLRKAQKLQKLKKITNMNDEINKKIRKIVDTFENYLTHREI